MKTVFITGAASGIGLATAKLFSERGYFVGLYDIQTDVVKTLLSSETFQNATGGFCDVTEPSSIKEALDDFTRHPQANGRLDVLINNAGALTSGFFHEQDPKQHDAIIAINVKGVTDVAYLGHSYLKATPNSVLINLCSVSSIHGIPLLAVYSASKFYVRGLSEALSIEWEPDGIDVVAIKPPAVATKMGADLHPSLTQKLAVELEPRDVASTIYQAVSKRPTSEIMTYKANAWAFINRFLPQQGRRRLTKIIAGF